MRWLNWGLCGLLCCSVVQAHFLGEHEKGWHWYDDPKEEVATPENPVNRIQVTAPSSTKGAEVETRLAQLQRIAKKRLSLAVMEPTAENVRAYIEIQNLITQMAHRFSVEWQHVLWQTPSLDYRLQAPTNQLAGQIHKEQKLSKRQQKLRQLAKTTGLFFVFKSTCPYCHRFAPTVKALSERYGFEVMPISLDNQGLAGFEDPKPAGNLPQQLAVQAVPAIYAISPQREEIIPITFGLISQEELEKRLGELL